MKSHIKLFSSMTARPSIKFFYNILFLKYSSTFSYYNKLFPTFFLNTKTLKIRYLKNNTLNTFWWLNSIFFLTLIITASFFLFITYFDSVVLSNLMFNFFLYDFF